MKLEISYPHDRASLEPRPMRAQQIWGIAEQVRHHVTPHRQTPCLNHDRLIAATARIKVNGIDIATHWDFERTVHDGQGRAALGVTEADPALPGIVLISLNEEHDPRQSRIGLGHA